MQESKIRLAVFSDYGSCSLPEWIVEQLPTPIYGVESRIKLAQILDNLKPTCKVGEANQALWDKFVRSNSMKSNPYFKLDGDNKVYLKICKENSSLTLEVEVSVEEVDTSKPWRIVEYDGAEYIEVFQGITVTDTKYNLCEW